MVADGVSFVEPNPTDLIRWGANFDAFLESGEGWRTITSVFVHYGFLHLLVNVVALFVIGCDFERRYGSLLLVITFFTGAVVAGIGSYFYNFFLISTGASGAIMALAGALLMGLVFLPGTNYNRRVIEFSQLMFIILLNIGLGLYLKIIDNAAHIAGLLWGIVAGLLVFPVQVKIRWVVFVRFLSVIFLSVSILFMAIFTKEPYRFWYFTMFNSFIQNDKQTVELLNSNVGPDDPLISLAGLNEASLVWYKNLEMLELFQEPPKKLEHDLSILKEIFSLRNQSLGHMKNYVVSGDLAFTDSIHLANETIKNLPPLDYWLVFEKQNSDSTSKDTIQTSDLFIWYDENWRETTKENALFYRSGKQDVFGNPHGPIKDHFLSGSVQMKGSYFKGIEDGIFFYFNPDGSYEAYGRYQAGYKRGDWKYFDEQGRKMSEMTHTDTEFLIKNSWNSEGEIQVDGGEGSWLEYYDDGSIAVKGSVSLGKKEGQWLGYFKNGKPYYRELFSQSKLLSGQSRDSLGNIYEYSRIEELPTTFGGKDAWINYLKSEIKITNPQSPSIAIVKATISEKGELLFAESAYKIGSQRDEEALRLVNNWNRFVAGKTRGQFVKKDLYISIDFYELSKKDN